MARKNATQNIQAVAIGLAERDLIALTLERVDGQQVVHCTRKTWRKTARDLGTPTGKAELVASLTELASELKLQGVPLHVALSSDFCVTRVISGENESVQRELQELCERSRVYLSLGVGDKTYAISEAAIDQRRRHVWVSVANLRVVTTIFEAFKETKLNLVRLEHSLGALSRLVHQQKADVTNPVLAIDVSQRVVDVGICFKGQLLLDYRPSGTNAKDSAGIIITRHTKRLQRYLDRLLKRESADFKRICLCGDIPDIGSAREKLEEKATIEVQLLDPSMAAGDWQLDEDVAHDHRLCGAFGMLLAQFQRDKSQAYPNLLDPLTAAHRGPLVRQIVKLAWPVIGTIAASMGIMTYGITQQWKCSAIEAELATLEDGSALVNRHQREIQGIEQQITHLSNIRSRLPHANWDKLMATVGHSLPRGVWLDSFQADRIGEVTIAGTSHTQDGVFEFIRHLKSIPNLSSVALESTAQTILSTGPAVQFVLKATPRGPADVSKNMKTATSKVPPAPRSAKADAEDLVERLQRAGVLIRGEVILR